MASWLVYSPLDQAVQLRAWARGIACVMILGNTLTSHSASFQSGMTGTEMGTCEFKVVGYSPVLC